MVSKTPIRPGTVPQTCFPRHHVGTPRCKRGVSGGREGSKCYVTLCKLLAFSEYLMLFPILHMERVTAKWLVLMYHTNIFNKQVCLPLCSLCRPSQPFLPPYLFSPTLPRPALLIKRLLFCSPTCFPVMTSSASQT